MLAWETLLDESIPAHLVKLLDEIEARKILMPLWREGWDWAGVERWNRDRLINQILYATRSALTGREVRIQKSIGCATIAGIIFLGLIGLSVLFAGLSQFIFY